MVKRILIGLVALIIITDVFAGFSGGGRSGFNGGGRSGFGSSSRSYSVSRSATVNRTYSRPSTNYRSSSTVVNNHHYNHGGYGFGSGGFFSGFLGGYLGGSLANNHHTTVVAGGTPIVQSQGPLVDGYTQQPVYYQSGSGFTTFLMNILLLAFVIFAVFMLYRYLRDTK